MHWKQQSPKSLIIFILIMALSAGFAAAHDTGQPHSHDEGDDLSQYCGAANESVVSIDGSDEGIFAGLPANHPPVVILVVGADDQIYSPQWLWRHLQSVLIANEGSASATYTHSHQHAHSHSHEHLHTDSDSHPHRHADTLSGPHSHTHSHMHSHAHRHRVGIAHDCQHDPAPRDETSQAQSPSQFD